MRAVEGSNFHETANLPTTETEKWRRICGNLRCAGDVRLAESDGRNRDVIFTVVTTTKRCAKFSRERRQPFVQRARNFSYQLRDDLPRVHC